MTAETESRDPLPIFELTLVVGLPLLSIMVGISLALVAYLHGFADLAATATVR